jgi:WhiB family redox-sensing transcriptional regulator
VSAEIPADWRDRARCRDVDPELFFPVGTTGPALFQEQSAKEVCSLCPVAKECLTWALSQRREMAGIWGGVRLDDMDRWARADLRKRLRRSA